MLKGLKPGMKTRKNLAAQRIINDPAARKKEALEQKAKRQAERDLILSLCFDKQQLFLEDPSKRKAIFCPRRAGKTYVLGLYLIQEALRYAKRKSLYIGMSKNAAVNAMWDDIMFRILTDNQIPHRYNSVQKVIRFENGSTITLTGMDAGSQEIKKVLGGKYHLAIIDECQDMRQDLEQAVLRVLEPAMLDYKDKGGGVIVMAGTPGIHMGDTDYWFQVTRPDHQHRVPDWSVHTWTMLDNPRMRDVYLKDCQEKAKRNPDYQADHRFQREYLGNWVTDTGTHIYQFNDKNKLEDMHLTSKLLSAHKDFTYLIGLDLGWHDADGIVILAYSSELRQVYIVESLKFNHAPTDIIGTMLKDYDLKYRPMKIMVDTAGSGRIIMEDLRLRFGLPCFAAVKTDKASYIGRMNSDFHANYIQVIPTTNKELIKEWQELLIDQKLLREGRWAEIKTKDNHLADACLYAYKETAHIFALQPKKKEQPKDFLQLVLEQDRKRSSQPQELEWWEKQEQEAECLAIVREFQTTRKR